MPAGYYAQTVPALVRHEQRSLSPFRRAELDRFAAACRTEPKLRGMVQTLFDRLLPSADVQGADTATLAELLEEFGFDRVQHEQIKADMRSGRIGLAQNRLPVTSRIEDVHEDELVDFGHSDAVAQRRR